LPDKHQWLGKLLLRSPGPIRALRNVPVVGRLIHIVSQRTVASNEKVWSRIEAGPGKGLWIELNPRTGQQYLRGQVESAIQSILAERLRPGMVFYDLGANIGLFSLIAARLVGLTGQVFSFEPDPETVTRLRRNFARNRFQNAKVIQAGVWSSSGKQSFQWAGPSSPDHGVGRFEAGESGASSAELDCITLDDFIASRSSPDAIKCDVEGAEVEVLRGATKLLRSRRPWIVCEIHSEAKGQNVRQILREAGYRIESVDTNHIVAVPKHDI
jgi:FkbM family methyltransferase